MHMHYLTSLDYPRIHWRCEISHVFSYMGNSVNQKMIQCLISQKEWVDGFGRDLLGLAIWELKEKRWYVGTLRLEVVFSSSYVYQRKKYFVLYAKAKKAFDMI